jgi:hypothetical protein
MERFYLEATIEFNRVYLLRDKMNESYEQVVRFYGEDSVTMPPDEFFGIFKTFTTTWEVSSTLTTVVGHCSNPDLFMLVDRNAQWIQSWQDRSRKGWKSKRSGTLKGGQGLGVDPWRNSKGWTLITVSLWHREVGSSD